MWGGADRKKGNEGAYGAFALGARLTERSSAPVERPASTGYTPGLETGRY